MLRLFSFIIIASLFFASCDEAPILSQATIFKDGNKAVIITMENIVTITSKKSGGGVTMKSGYTSCYLNAIDAKTGESLKRKKIGDYQERIDLLGQCGGKVWGFSYDKDLGIHARDPQTLEVLVSAKDIIAKNPSMSAGFADQGYQFNLDSSLQKIFVTTKDGYTYTVDPVSLLATRVEERVNRRYYGADDATESSNVELSDSVELSWKSDTRKALTVEWKYFDQSSYKFFSQGGSTPSKSLYYKTAAKKDFRELSYIEPKFILDRMAPKKEQNDDVVLIDDKTVFILSKSVLGNDFNWIISAIHIGEQEAKLLWQKELTGTEKVEYSNKDLLTGDVTDGKLVLIFENLMIVFDCRSGNEVWRKVVRKGD